MRKGKISCPQCGHMFLRTLGRKGEKCPGCGHDMGSIVLHDKAPSAQATTLGMGVAVGKGGEDRGRKSAGGTILGLPVAKRPEDEPVVRKVSASDPPPLEIVRQEGQGASLRPDEILPEEASIVVDGLPEEGLESSEIRPSGGRADNSSLTTKREMKVHRLPVAQVVDSDGGDDFSWAQKGRKLTVAAILILVVVLLPFLFYWFYIRPSS